MVMKTIICLSFIVLNNFFANMCVKKNVPHQPNASPHVTADTLAYVGFWKEGGGQEIWKYWRSKEKFLYLDLVRFLAQN